MRRNAMILMLGVFPLAAAAGEKGSAMNDHEKIQGTWQLVSGERHGKAFPEQVVRNVTLEFAGDTLATRNKDHVSKAKFSLHPDQAPKGIDLDMDGVVGMGIYKLDGDMLTIMHGEAGDLRPKGFDPKQIPESTLMVLKRTKKSQPGH